MCASAPFFFWTSCSIHCYVAPDLGTVLSSHSTVSSCRTVRPCSPWGGRWIGHRWTTWSTVCSSAPHSQVAEKAISHLYKQLSRTQAFVGRVILGGGCRCRGWKCGVSHSAFHWWSAYCAARMLLSDELMRCCAAGTNGCLVLRRRAVALDGRVSAERSRCPGSMARRARDSVARTQCWKSLL